MRGGFTLLELLVALALILLVAGLALPDVSRLVADRTFTHAVEELRGQFRVARAEARARGTVFQAVLSGPPNSGDRNRDPAQIRVGSLFSGDDGASAAASGGPSAAWAGSWATRRLPAGFNLTQDGNDDAAGMSTPDDFGLTGGAHERLLALFLPDGTVLVPRAIHIDDGQGRHATMVARAWAGSPAFHRTNGPTVGETGAEGEADPDFIPAPGEESP